ncbi:MAG: hypothetical protein PVJ39_08940 [Gammaproteobacteria bacterium]
MRALFGEALVDEIALYGDAKDFLMDRHGKLTEQCLEWLTKTRGLELATMTLYVWLKEFRHREFCDTVSALDARPDENPSTVKLVIVPGMFYREFPELGGDGRLMQQIARRCGIEASIAPIASTGALEDNAQILSNIVREHAGQKIWLASVSKGSAEAGLALAGLSEKQRQCIRGWISICGIFKGSPVADIRLKRPFGRLVLKTYMKWIGADFRGIDDMRTGYPSWNKNLVDHGIETIHVQPVPLAGHVHPDLVKRYRQLAANGPNDGTIYLNDLITRSGHVYPVWGADHFFHDSAVVPLIYKLCHYLKNQSAGRNCRNESTENDNKPGAAACTVRAV